MSTTPSTPKEIILEALRGGKPERIPAALIGGGMWSAYDYGTTLKALADDAARMARMLVDMSGRLESDIVYAGSGYPNIHAAALGGRIRFREIGALDLEGPVLSPDASIDTLDLSRIDGDRLTGTVREATRMARAQIGDRYLVTLTAWGPFTLGARIVGEERLIRAILKDPGFVHSTLDFVIRLLIRLFEPLVADGTLELIVIGDPTASGDLISRRQFEEFALPALRKFTDWTKTRNVLTLLHICGDTTDRLDLFPLTGASCISLDHKTDIVRARETLHGRMCFAGNVDPVEILLRGTVNDVEDACRKVIAAAGTDGGFILMPGCDIPPTVPFENIQKFVQVAGDWRD